MAVEELLVVRLKDDFYRDGFYKTLTALTIIIAAIVLLISLSVYIYVTKPNPVYFSSDDEWRILSPVPVDQVYISDPDLIQWVSETIPAVFTYDFINYTDQLKGYTQYFTTNGWQKFLEQINEYANFKTIQDSKLFTNAAPAGAPFVLNKGMLNGRYSWWVQMPVALNYISANGSSTTSLVVQALVTRVSTLNNLSGVGIENIIVVKGGGDQIITHAE